MLLSTKNQRHDQPAVVSIPGVVFIKSTSSGGQAVAVVSAVVKSASMAPTSMYESRVNVVTQPDASVMVSVTEYKPLAEYVWHGNASDDVSFVPASPKSHKYVNEDAADVTALMKQTGVPAHTVVSIA